MHEYVDREVDRNLLVGYHLDIYIALCNSAAHQTKYNPF